MTMFGSDDRMQRRQQCCGTFVANTSGFESKVPITKTTKIPDGHGEFDKGEQSGAKSGAKWLFGQRIRM